MKWYDLMRKDLNTFSVQRLCHANPCNLFGSTRTLRLQCKPCLGQSLMILRHKDHGHLISHKVVDRNIGQTCAHAFRTYSLGNSICFYCIIRCFWFCLFDIQDGLWWNYDMTTKNVTIKTTRRSFHSIDFVVRPFRFLTCRSTVSRLSNVHWLNWAMTKMGPWLFLGIQVYRGLYYSLMCG